MEDLYCLRASTFRILSKRVRKENLSQDGAAQLALVHLHLDYRATFGFYRRESCFFLVVFT